MCDSYTEDKSNHDIFRQSFVDDSNTDIFETQNQEDLRKALYYLHCNEGKLQRLTSKQKKLKEYIDCIVKIIGDSETSVEASLHTGIQTAQKEHWVTRRLAYRTHRIWRSTPDDPSAGPIRGPCADLGQQ